jgi:hypothetical protein
VPNGAGTFARGLSDLAIVSAADLAATRDWADFGRLLNNLRTAQDLSFTDIEVQAKRLKLPRDLPRSTVNPALNGKVRPSRDVLLSLLKVFGVVPDDQAVWLETWQRMAAAPSAGPSLRFDEVSPRQLGIHAAITLPDSAGELPEYVERDFDDYLRKFVSAGTDQGCFVLLVGRSSTGKTRSLYEAVHAVAPNWPIVQPAGTEEIIELLDGTRRRIILWLDEMERFFDAQPRLTKEHVARLFRFPALVVATLWPDDYLKRKSRRGRPAELEFDRRLLDLAEVIPVPDEISHQEHERAQLAAERDKRIRLALNVTDAGLTQALAAGPELLHRWELAPDPYAKAVMSFAADARRLGVLSPLPEEALKAAIGGYLTPAQRVNRPRRWLPDALAFCLDEVHGGVSVLAQADDEEGTLVGYVVADYVAQHVRQTECPPRSAWETLVATAVDVDDLRRLVSAANARMRYCHEEQALRRLFELHGEGAADLAGVLFRAGRDQEATDLLSRRLAMVPDDRPAQDRLRAITALAQRISGLRAERDARAKRRLAELFADGGLVEDVRVKADGGSLLFEEDLAVLLAERGSVDELVERADQGKEPAANALAELLATHGRTERLQQRATAGDQVAARQLEKLLAAGPAADGVAVQTQLAHLRRRISTGDESAAQELTALLFDLRSEGELRREVNAGTFGAADRLVALLNADETMDRSEIDSLRAYGLSADGTPFRPQVA